MSPPPESGGGRSPFPASHYAPTVTSSQPDDLGVPLSALPDAVKAVRSGSFGTVAAEYERFRASPPESAVTWLLPSRVGRVVDLGAGTGALTRLLIDRADEVVAIEPDPRMRQVLINEVPDARAVDGRGESMPLPDHAADAVLASSSWHWMEVGPTLDEVARVLVPGGLLAALWSGPDPDGPFMSQARELLGQPRARSTELPAGGADTGAGGGLTRQILGDAVRPVSRLEIPAGAPFEPPELHVDRWDVALDADELIGLMSTLSWIITMDDETRANLFVEARRLLSELLGIEGEVTVDVTYRCDTWRTRCLA